MSRCPKIGLALAALALASCDRATETETTEIAAFCVETQAIDGGDRLVVSVTLDECLSSSCDRVEESECTVTDVGDELRLEAWALIHHEGRTCTADCGSPMASCWFVPDGEREYTIRADDLTLQYGFPGGVQACAGEL